MDYGKILSVTIRIKSIHEVSHRHNDSQMWYDLLKIKDIYLQGRVVTIRNGEKVRFWLDVWLYDEPLCKIALVLFELCDNKMTRTVA